MASTERADLAILTRYGPGTPMGELLREHWIPALPSSNLVADGRPERVRLLGEDLVAFRASDGTVGVLNEACPHRRVSLALARNEDCGLRCLFHGWKLNTAGRVVDTPNVADNQWGERIPATGHPVAESGGIVWVYLGRRSPAPALPDLGFTRLHPDHVFLMPGEVRANWLAVIEAGFDQTHVRILHQSSLAEAYGHEGMAVSMLNIGHTRFHFESKSYGASWSFVDVGEGGHERVIRTGEYVFPFWDMIGLGSGDGTAILLQVPVDDSSTMLWAIFYNADRPLRPDDTGSVFAGYVDPGATTYRTRFPSDAEGRWGQDRSAMDRHWTGIGIGRGGVGLFFEDIALLESIASTDRSAEHLAPSDALFTRVRHRIFDAIRDHEEGKVPTAHADVHDVEPAIPQPSSEPV